MYMMQKWLYLQGWHCIAHLMLPDIQVLLACHINIGLKRFRHHQVQQWQMQICQDLQSKSTQHMESG